MRASIGEDCNLITGPRLHEIYAWHFGEGRGERAQADDEAPSDIYPFDTTHSVSLPPARRIFTHAAFSCHLILLSDDIHLHLIASIFPSQNVARNSGAMITLFSLLYQKEFCTKGLTKTHGSDMTACTEDLLHG